MAVAVVPGDEIVDRVQERAVLRAPRVDLGLAIRVEARVRKRLGGGMRDGHDGENRHGDADRPGCARGRDAKSIKRCDGENAENGDEACRNRRPSRAGQESLQRDGGKPDGRGGGHAARGRRDADDEPGQRRR